VDPSNAYTLPADVNTNLSSETAEDEFDFTESLLVMTETRIFEITTRFRRDADAYYVEAKRSTVSSIAQVPYWIYCLMVVLGWNEAMAVLFNPLYFTLLLISLVSA
jgi:hypothetical protein